MDKETNKRKAKFKLTQKVKFENIDYEIKSIYESDPVRYNLLRFENGQPVLKFDVPESSIT